MGTTILEPEPIASDAPASLSVPPGVRLKVDADGFAALCAVNRDLRLERDAEGGLIVMTPASPDSSDRNMELSRQLANWSRAAGLGKAFDSSGGFTFPDGAVRAPDASWMSRDRWDRIPPEERRRFARAAPDFVAELRSPSDSLPDLRAKMTAYIAQGVRLGWLIDPASRTVEIHRPGRAPEVLTRPAALSGEDVLPGFTLDLKGVLFD